MNKETIYIGIFFFVISYLILFGVSGVIYSMENRLCGLYLQSLTFQNEKVDMYLFDEFNKCNENMETKLTTKFTMFNLKLYDKVFHIINII